MNIIKEAEEFEQKMLQFKKTGDRLVASRKANQIILDLNAIYNLGYDPRIMDLMKRITIVKKKIEKRFKEWPLTA